MVTDHERNFEGDEELQLDDLVHETSYRKTQLTATNGIILDPKNTQKEAKNSFFFFLPLDGTS